MAASWYASGYLRRCGTQRCLRGDLVDHSSAGGVRRRVLGGERDCRSRTGSSESGEGRGFDLPETIVSWLGVCRSCRGDIIPISVPKENDLFRHGEPWGWQSVVDYDHRRESYDTPRRAATTYGPHYMASPDFCPKWSPPSPARMSPHLDETVIAIELEMFAATRVCK